MEKNENSAYKMPNGNIIHYFAAQDLLTLAIQSHSIETMSLLFNTFDLSIHKAVIAIIDNNCHENVI
jgi:hypothetical protein